MRARHDRLLPGRPCTATQTTQRQSRTFLGVDPIRRMTDATLRPRVRAVAASNANHLLIDDPLSHRCPVLPNVIVLVPREISPARTT